MTNPARKDFSKRSRPFSLQCPMCDETWEGTNLKKIAKRIAWHWNKDHNNQFRDKAQIDTIERGGHQTTDNHWTVERIPIHLTVFDVLEERLGQEDGWATVQDHETVCKGCLRETPEEEYSRVIIDDTGYHTKWRCGDCFEREQLHKNQKENRSLDDFTSVQGECSGD